MELISSPTTTWLAACAALLGVYMLYRQALPKPLPGIPYDAQSAGRIAGDLPKILDKKRRGDLARSFFPELFSTSRAPVVQYFMGPFKKAVVAVGDYCAAKDLLVRHSRDFTRGHSIVAMWKGTMPRHFLGMDDGDPELKKGRELSRDLMTPRFLHEVNAPTSYGKVMLFVELWQRKSSLASGCAFDASDDLRSLTYDIIMAAALNISDDETQIKNSMALLDQEAAVAKQSEISADLATFPPVELSNMLKALNKIAAAAGKSITMPIPALFHFFNNRTADMKRAYRDRDTIIASYIADSVHRLEGDAVDSFAPTSAVDFIVKREASAAAKDGRKPAYFAETIIQTIFGYLLGGQDSTHSTLSFMVKHLGAEQEKQTTLRNHLRDAFPEESARRQQPPLKALLAAQIPYLDAVIEEVLRINPPAFGTTRRATREMEVLGHVIPKDTPVFLSFTGATYTEPGYHARERKGDLKRDAADSDDEVGGLADWAGSEFPMNEFHPERWLKECGVGLDGTKTMTFDARAGPFLSFGGGNRICWGRKLAYLELRLVVSLLVWNFVFDRLPEDLDDWQLMEDLFVKPKTCRVKLRSVWE